MKKAVLSLLLVLGLLCGCGQRALLDPGTEQPILEQMQPADSAQTPSGDEYPDGKTEEGTETAEEVDPLLQTYISALPGMAAPVREYGESVSYIHMEEDFVVRILYPAGELAELDRAAESWARETMEQYAAEVTDAWGEDPAELTVDYSSYVVRDTLVGVKLEGIFDRAYLAHPVDVSATFNADRTTGKLLKLSDLLRPGGEDLLRNRVIREAGIDAEAADAHLLNHWLLTHEGLEITLVRGEYLPMSAGTVRLFYSYEELEDIFVLSEPAAAEPPQPELPESEPPENGESTVVDPSKPMLALTFDDGPSAYTARLLDAFAAHGGKGTFFVVGNMLDARPEVLRRMEQEGHEIGGHSWNHRQLTKLSREEVTDQLMNTRAKIYDITGVDATLMRPPYGSHSKQVRAVAGELGIALVNWSVDTLDWKHRNADTVYESVMAQAKDGAIILCHDLHRTTVDAMERAIPDLIAEGYQLVTVSELLEASGKTVSAGTVYSKG